MDGDVGRFHCRYRSMTNSPADAQFAARLNRVAKESLPDSLDLALDAALGDDPAVYILRNIKCDLFFNEDALADDAQLAREWAEKIAFAVVRAIRGAEEGSNVVRFADRADQIASFIVDLLRGEAWASWFHDAFDHLRKHDFRTALNMALGESGRDLAAVLVFLHRRGFFEKVVARLEPNQLHVIWQKLRDDDAVFLSRASSAWRASVHDEGTLEGVFASVEADQGRVLGEKSCDRDATSMSRDVTALRTSAHDDSAFEGAFASAEPDQKRIPDEQLFDRETAEAEALRPLFMTALRLVELLDFCADERLDTERLFRLWLASRPSPPHWVDSESLTAAVLDALRFLRQSIAARAIREEDRAVVNRRLASWLANNGWLAQDQFAESAARLLFEPNVAMPLPDLPRRPADFLSTPRQRRLLEELRQALRGQSIRWGEPLESPANALRLLTLLVARFPQWSGDPLVAPFIERFLRELAGGTGIFDIPEFQTHAPQLPATGAATPVTLAAAITKAMVTREGGAVYSACAGVFLLVRALLDLRMPALVASAAWAPLPATLLGLGLRWAGETGLKADRIDAGLGILAGTDDLAFEPLRDVWGTLETGRHARFQAVLLQTLAAQHLVDPSEMHALHLPFGDANALVAGVGEGNIWPLSRILKDGDRTETVVADWKQIWKEATGTEPQVLERTGTDDCETLRGALTSVSGGGTGNEETDLVIALAAIAVMRAWARWLRQFARSSTPWLLDNLIRRPGNIRLGGSAILVELEPRPLDIVIEMAGYTSDIHRVPWLGGRNIIFRRLAV